MRVVRIHFTIACMRTDERQGQFSKQDISFTILIFFLKKISLSLYQPIRVIRIGHDVTYQEAEAERSRAQTPASGTQGNPVKNKTKQINKRFFLSGD